MNAAELEIALHRRDADSYNVDLRFVQPGDDADVRAAYGELAPLRIDQAALLRATDPTSQGRTLTQALFVETKVQAAFEKALTAAQTLDVPLRVRLFIGPSAPELHNYRWETLVDPATDPATDPAASTPLLTNENIIFSRYLSSLDWRPVRLRPQRDLTALVVVASPNDVTERFKMAAVNVEQELETARTGLGDISCTEVTQSGTATLTNIVDHLRNEVDILYLVAHGALVNGEPILYLEDEAGKTTPTPGSELVTRLRELPVRPRLVVLASCQSAGDGSSDTSMNDGAQDDGALAGLGPRLAEAGAPAVLAMQGKISMETVRHFMPLFFEELRRDGQIDRAMAAARGQVRDRHDWWMPVLFMRLRDGKLFKELPLEFSREMPIEAPWEPETVPIRAGTFRMGSDEGATHERSIHEVTLQNYRLGKYPITNRQFEFFVNAKDIVVAPEMGWEGQTPDPNMRDHPVRGVTFREAIDFCKWLSEETGRVYQLPTEAHWEKAARTDDGRTYPWGNEWQPDRCNHGGTATVAVDEFPAQNEHGCHDMVGNVREWTRSLWGERLREPDDAYAYPWLDDERNDANANDQIRRVWRGGGYADKESQLHCAARGNPVANQPRRA